MVKRGSKAPDFVLKDAQSNTLKLSDFLGQKVVLFFYPKDNTPGCTQEALDFTRAKNEFSQKNTVVIGVSKDSCSSHARFIQKHALEVVLLSDEDAHIQNAYGVWQEKSFMGKKYMGTARTTFLIDEAGIILQIWDNVKVNGHVQQVLDYLNA